MKQSKTKKALLMSMLSMLLCVAMLVGMTFAWFTDTASTSVNKIQAGTLNVALEMQTNDGWVPAEGKTLDFVKSANAPENEEILWEPGAKYDLPKIQIKNDGNLALKYKVVFSAVSGDTKLAEALDVYMNEEPVKVNGKQATLKDVLTSTDSDGFAHGNLLAGATSGEITISMHMQETAGNEYQGLAINGVAITVLATQDTVEYDSTTNQYDKEANAEYIVEVSTIEELRAAIKKNVGAKIVLADDIIIGDDKLEVVDTAKNKNGMLLIDKNTIIDLNGKTLAYDGGTNDNCWYIFYVKNANLTIIDSSENNSGKVYGNDPDGTWAVMIREGIGGTVNIYGGHYMSKDGAAVYTNDGDINIYGGIFETEENQNQLLYMGKYTGSMRVYGGTFKNYDPSETIKNIKLADGYKVESTTSGSDKWYTVVAE